MTIIEKNPEKGSPVLVNMPSGWMAGKVVEVMENYEFTKERHYIVEGKDLYTIVSDKNIYLDDGNQ